MSDIESGDMSFLQDVYDVPCAVVLLDIVKENHTSCELVGTLWRCLFSHPTNGLIIQEFIIPKEARKDV